MVVSLIALLLGTGCNLAETDTELEPSSTGLTTQTPSSASQDTQGDSLQTQGEALPEGCTWGHNNQGLKIPVCGDPSPPPRAAAP